MAGGVSAVTARLQHIFQRLLEAVTLVLMVALAVVVMVGVVFRKAGAALVWYDEVASILLAWLTFYGAALAALHRLHLGFPQIVQALRPAWRWPAVVVREVVVIGFFAVVAWAGWRVIQVLGGTYLISLPRVSARVSQSVIPLGAILFIVAELVGVRNAWRSETARGRGTGT